MAAQEPSVQTFLITRVDCVVKSAAQDPAEPIVKFMVPSAVPSYCIGMWNVCTPVVVVLIAVMLFASVIPEPDTVSGVKLPAVLTLMLTIKSNWLAVPNTGAGLSCV